MKPWGSRLLPALPPSLVLSQLKMAAPPAASHSLSGGQTQGRGKSNVYRRSAKLSVILSRNSCFWLAMSVTGSPLVDGEVGHVAFLLI